MQRHRALPKIALCCAVALAAAAAGCSNKTGLFEANNDGGWFSKPLDVFAKPEWAKLSAENKVVDLGPKGPVAPGDLVGADGRCAPPVAAEPVQAAAASPAGSRPSDRPVGLMAGDLAGAPMPAAVQAAANPGADVPGATDPAMPPVIGGIALGMTECQAVRRAGLPGNVTIGAGGKGERNVMLTYLSGPWPGIYRFADGRLREIERAPAPPEPPKAPPKKNAKKPVKKPKTAAN
ncbi:MAG: hypothetical protein HY543_12560 [Deltaproteobacteria bacterium]|nr:hypothetical protein [Deltaproteobacteria bacterium]